MSNKETTKKRIVRKPYERVRVAYSSDEPSATHQSFKDECDINSIMAKWQKTGVVEHRNQFEGQYADFTNTPGDFHEAQNQILHAQEMFMTLPSSIRSRFHNDPGSFLDFTSDPKNLPEMVKMGLATSPLSNVIDDALAPPPAPKKPPSDEKSAD